MISINTNLSSLLVQSSLKQSTNGLNQAIERMITGFKINGAKDNAAGYSISTNMSTKISAYQVAEDNVSTGLDLLTTAGDSLSLISNHLSRIRDLTTQAKNGTYGEESMKAINSEINARLDEIQRLYDTTEFNGLKLFGGETQVVGGGEDGSSLISTGAFLQAVTPRDTSTMTTLASVDENVELTSGTYSISTAEELAKLATMTNNAKIASGCEFVLANDIDLSAYSTGEGWTPIGKYSSDYSKCFQATFDGNGYVVKNLYINRPNEDNQGLFGYCYNATIENVGLEGVNVTGKDYAGALVGDVYYYTNITNCYTTGDASGTCYVGGFAGFTQPGISITNSYSTGNASGNWGVGGFVGRANAGSITNSYSTGDASGNKDVGDFVGYNNGSTIDAASGHIDKDAPKPFEYTPIASTTPTPAPTPTVELSDILFQVGIHSNAESQIALNTSFALTNLAELRNIGLSEGNYFETIDNILASISAKQTEYGACQNRLESALEEINTHYENLLSSRSTLRDADVAQESSAYIRNQILQQASATLLATANQSPSVALQLL